MNRDGYLISSPSTSPENSFRIDGQSYTVSDGCEMDHRIIQNLFANCMKACELLDIDPDFYEAVAAASKKIAPVRIGRYGQIQEWYQDWDNPEDKHRHISQLYGLHPAQLISPLTTPELSEAARVTLNCRIEGKDGDDASTGWSRAWKINCWSRLLDGNRAYKIVRGLIKERLNHNLFCIHPPFQIDGNLGYTAGIAEMLLQSNYEREIHLLPALPDSWPDGTVKGLRARGNFTVDISWRGGMLSEALIAGKPGEKGELRYRDRQMLFELDDEGKFVLTASMG